LTGIFVRATIRNIQPSKFYGGDEQTAVLNGLKNRQTRDWVLRVQLPPPPHQQLFTANKSLSIPVTDQVPCHGSFILAFQVALRQMHKHEFTRGVQQYYRMGFSP
jgi:hypothetical protein